MPSNNISTAGWNYALNLSAGGPMGAGAVVNMAPVAPRPPLPAYPQQVTSYAIPKANFIPSTSPTGPRAAEFYGMNSAGKPLAPVTNGPVYAAPGVRGPAPFSNPQIQPHPSSFLPAPTSTANNPLIPGRVPAQPGTGQGAMGMPQVPTRGAPAPNHGIPGSRGGYATGAGNVAMAGIYAGMMMAQGVPIPQALGATIGGMAGGALGAAGGAALGGLIGGPPGAVIGGQAGMAVGSILGGAIGTAIANAIAPPAPEDALAGGPAVEQLPPFTGGQSAGITYFAVYNTVDTAGNVSESSIGFLTGPVGGISSQQNFNNSGNPMNLWNFQISHAGGVLSAQFVSSTVRPYSFRFLRADGRPDTGGNPPGAIISPAAPRPANALPSNPPLAGGAASPTPAAPPAPPAAPPVAPPAAPPATEPPPDILPDNSPNEEEGETTPAKAPLYVPSPPSPELTVGTGVNQSTIPGQPTEIEKNSPTEWEVTLSDGRKVKYTKKPDGTIDLELPGTNWVGLPAVGAVVGTTLVGVGPKPVPKGPQAPTGTTTNTGSQVKVDPLTNQTTQPPAPPRQYPTGNGNPCGCNAPLLNGLGDLNRKIDLLGAGGEAASTAAILNKLNQMQQYAETAWKATKIDKVVNLLTLISALHNASMLSRDIAETLGYAIDNALQAAGVPIKDEEGNQISVTDVVGTSVQNFVKGILGADVYNGLRETYQKANRIVQTASMVIWTVRSIQDSALDLAEWTAENTGKIGNALKKFGVVGERAYGWMSENPRAHNRFRARFDKLTGRLERAEDFASTFATGTSNVLELTQETAELGENWQAFQQSVIDFKEEPWPDNNPVKEEAALAAANAQSPPISAADTERGS